MDSEEQAQTLMEMGFSHEQAQEALQATSHDLPKAIAYLFGELDTQGTGTQQSPFVLDQTPLEDTVAVSNPQDMPNFASFPSLRSLPKPIVEMEEDIDMSERNEDAMDRDSDNLSSGEIDFESDLPPNEKTEGHLFPVLLTTNSRYHQYWAPLLLILAHQPSFAGAVLDSDLITIDTSDSEKSQVNEPETENKEPASDPETQEFGESDAVPNAWVETTPANRFLTSLEGLVKFVQHFNTGSTWYYSLSELQSSLPADLDDGDFDEEVVVTIFEHLMQQIPALRLVLESRVESIEEEISKEITVLEIDVETRNKNLYASLNELFWQKSFSRLGVIKYSHVAPIVTYQLLCEEPSGILFELAEFLYPEIYSDKALKGVQGEVDKVDRAFVEMKESSKKKMDYTIFEGKPIRGLLKQTRDILAQDNAEDLNSKSSVEELDLLLNLHTEKARAAAEEEEAWHQQASGEELVTYLNTVKANKDLKKYNLLGVVMLASYYYVKSSGAWVDMRDRVVVDFEEIQEIVDQAARMGSGVVTLIYAAESGV